MVSSNPPGWYPDPHEPESQRYWDGESWLNIPPPPREHSAPRSQAELAHKAGKMPITVVLAIALVLGGGLVTWKLISDHQAAQLQAQEAEEKKLAEEADAKAKRLEEERAEAVRKAREEETERAEQAERQHRQDSVAGIEDSVFKMAEEHASTGVVTGPILEAKCTAVGGGSTDDLDQRSTVFECFVAYQRNDDGSQMGYYYHATMNWTTGQYTYGLGAP